VVAQLRRRKWLDSSSYTAGGWWPCVTSLVWRAKPKVGRAAPARHQPTTLAPPKWPTLTVEVPPPHKPYTMGARAWRLKGYVGGMTPGPFLHPRRPRSLLWRQRLGEAYCTTPGLNHFLMDQLENPFSSSVFPPPHPHTHHQLLLAARVAGAATRCTAQQVGRCSQGEPGEVRKR
jgi:hypothetical protein